MTDRDDILLTQHLDESIISSPTINLDPAVPELPDKNNWHNLSALDDANNTNFDYPILPPYNPPLHKIHHPPYEEYWYQQFRISLHDLIESLEKNHGNSKAAINANANAENDFDLEDELMALMKHTISKFKN
jgi:hypothetical protein